MRPIILASTRDAQQRTSLSSGPGAPIFENSGPHTRIYRAPVRAIGCAKFDGKEIYGQVLDISPGGCLFKTESTLEVGTKIELRVTIISPDSRAVAELAGVVRRTDTADGRPSYGIEFSANDSTDRRAHQWLYGKAIHM